MKSLSPLVWFALAVLCFWSAWLMQPERSRPGIELPELQPDSNVIRLGPARITWTSPAIRPDWA